MRLQLRVFSIFCGTSGKRMVRYIAICFILHCNPSLRYILLTRVYYFDVTVLCSLIRWFLGEILNSPDTRKPKTHFCQYYRGYQTYPYLSIVFMMLKKIKKYYTKLVKAVAIDYCRIIHAVLSLRKRHLAISFLRVFQ